MCIYHYTVLPRKERHAGISKYDHFLTKNTLPLAAHNKSRIEAHACEFFNIYHKGI